LPAIVQLNLILKIREHVGTINSSNMCTKMRGSNESTPPASPLISVVLVVSVIKLRFEDITLKYDWNVKCFWTLRTSQLELGYVGTGNTMSVAIGTDMCACDHDKNVYCVANRIFIFH
jgi:hypothetical protein